MALLTHSHRFSAQSGIGELARWVNQGDAARSLAVLQSAQWPEVSLQATLDDEQLLQRRQPYWQAVTASANLADLQQAFAAFMLLAAERRQVDDINRRMEAQCEAAGLKEPGRVWYLKPPGDDQRKRLRAGAVQR
ncbi:hypothetical protein [Paludibacterium denitrificans]|uniref:hypothetical protein n=1 Tax=Paludibacterium denitrificans TaxID=2675226 RepID=UPI001E5F3CED|nr:hypothetical protein [Paludibacterium denitrificans]